MAWLSENRLELSLIGMKHYWPLAGTSRGPGRDRHGLGLAGTSGAPCCQGPLGPLACRDLWGPSLPGTSGAPGFQGHLGPLGPHHLLLL